MKKSGLQQKQILEDKLSDIRAQKDSIVQKSLRLDEQYKNLCKAEEKLERTLANFGKKQPKNESSVDNPSPEKVKTSKDAKELPRMNLPE